jgi:hypothetical protein
VHLRRALLLFAIVLGLAAIAASVSRPPDESDQPATRPPPTAPEPDPAPTFAPGTATPGGVVELSTNADRWEKLRLSTGQAATLLVETDEPGEVEIPELGLVGPAEPLTPARFELLVSSPGRYEIVFTPVAEGQARPAATLVVEDGLSDALDGP